MIWQETDLTVLRNFKEIRATEGYERMRILDENSLVYYSNFCLANMYIYTSSLLKLFLARRNVLK